MDRAVVVVVDEEGWNTLGKSYPTLRRDVALRRHITEHHSTEDFQVVAKPNWTELLTEDLTTLLAQMDGKTPWETILGRYNEDSKQAIIQGLDDTIYQVSMEWLDEPSPISPYQVLPPVVQPVSLITVNFHINNQCNFRCAHCFHNEYQNDLNALTPAELDDLAEQFALSHVVNVNISGGEPFLYKNLLDFTEALTKRHVYFLINTNGFLVEKAQLEVLKDQSLQALSISLDGLTEESHNRIRKHPESWNRIMQLLDWMAEYNIPVRFASTMHPSWLKDLDQFESFLDRIQGNLICGLGDSSF